MANKTFIEYNYCATDWLNENGKCTLTLYNGSTVGLSEKCNTYTKKLWCSDSAKMNLTTHNYSYLMGLSGLSISIVFAFIINLIITFTSRK